MIRTCSLVALAVTLAAIAPIGSASARTMVERPDVATPSACAHDLASAECGRYQQRLLRLTALQAAGHRDPATLRANGRLQLDTLIDSIS